MLLEGKTALITGAANRLGAQIARTLHQNGANLIIHYRRSAADAKAFEQQLNAQRVDSASCIQADLNELEAITTLSHKAAHKYILTWIFSILPVFTIAPILAHEKNKSRAITVYHSMQCIIMTVIFCY